MSRCRQPAAEPKKPEDDEKKHAVAAQKAPSVQAAAAVRAASTTHHIPPPVPSTRTASVIEAIRLVFAAVGFCYLPHVIASLTLRAGVCMYCFTVVF